MEIACSSYKTYQIRRAVWNSTLFCFLFLFTISSDPVEANLFKVDNMLSGVNVYISCVKTRSARNFFYVWMVSSSASFVGRVKTKKPTLLGGGCVEICLNKVMSPSPGELLFDASAQSPPSDKTVEMLHFSYSRINGADFWTVVDLFDRVMRSKREV